MVYCDVNFIRTVSGLESEMIKDKNIRDLRDRVATPEMNDDLNYYVTPEQVGRIDSEKTNKIDDDNTTFYLKEVHQNHKFVGDSNDDGEVTDDDVSGYFVDGDSERHDVLITLVDAETGELTVTDVNGDPIPKSSKLYITYAVAPINQQEPHSMIKVACAQLTAAYSFTNIEATKLQSFSIGDVNISKQSRGYEMMKEQYNETVQRIIAQDVIDFGENVNEIKNVFSTPVEPTRRNRLEGR